MLTAKSGCCCAALPARRSSGFTLIELLVVISILALLMGFIIPVFFGTKDKGNMARAKAEAKQIEAAWKQFYLTYNRWPDGIGSTPTLMSGGIVEELGGRLGSVNTKKIMFFDIPPDSNGVYYIKDPWRKEYEVLFDHDFDNKISLPPYIGGGDLPRAVAVYTIFITKDNKTNIIKSWE